ncbi:hypothetical protein M3C61_06715 [Dermacoccus abyssi]|uniref:hypothetical protein n=1 Tax=Dermacoccus abyssi TaxID=322596 RepID=UPI0021A2DFB5|nr:hypothetical protein [Dermacoccus abyssi]MCT1986711.1 hypothetical protein [Dermacoccus abyssi]
MSLRFYADDSARRTRQLVADALLALWCLLAVWAGVIVHGRVLVAEDGATKLETGSGSLAQNMTDAASAVAKIPFVGQEVRTPFDNAATTGRNLSASGHDLADGLGRLSLTLGILTALVPILFALIPWCFTRLRYALRAGRVARLRAMPGGERLLALEGLTTLRPSVLASLDPDPAAAWQEGDRTVTRELAALVLVAFGLRGGDVSPERRRGAALPTTPGRDEPSDAGSPTTESLDARAADEPVDTDPPYDQLGDDDLDDDITLVDGPHDDGADDGAEDGDDDGFDPEGETRVTKA